MTQLILSIFLSTFSVHAQSDPFYSYAGSERIVHFTHTIQTDMTSLQEVQDLGAADRAQFVKYTIRPLMKFLFGPLTNRRIGGVQRDDFISVRWDLARVEGGKVLLDIDYKASWIIEKSLAGQTSITLPIPRNFESLFTKNWKRCTDSEREHATETYFWYYWDPDRQGCDHREGVQFDLVQVQIGELTSGMHVTYPEFNRMLRDENGTKILKMTYAFGYVNDPKDPRPESDMDYGAQEYRSFLFMIGSRLSQLSARPIHLNEYKNATANDRVIGYRFEGFWKGYRVDMEVVIAAGIDQIHLFAESFAHRHDAVFAWMGHSRVGGGFDAALFRRIVEGNPSYYSITNDYQLIYWGGCNSYSYYTLPFFEFKAKAFPVEDPYGTRGLDIIAHGLPSYFSLNAINAEILLKAVLSGKTSFQTLIRDLELNGSQSGARLLAVVLGDEDNEP